MKIFMRLFQHRGIFYIEHNSKRTSLKTRNKDEARRLYAAFKKKVLEGKIATMEGRCTRTLEQFAVEYLTWAENVQPKSTFLANRLALNKLRHYAGNRIFLDQISIKHIDQMISASKGLSPHSINNYIRHARAALNKAVEWGYVQSNPLGKVKEIRAPKRPPAFLDRHDAARFIASIKDVELRKMIVAYLVTGRRRSELLNLRWKDVNLDRDSYSVVGKGGEVKTFRINSMFRAVIMSMDRGAPGERVFPRWDHPDTVSKKVKAAMKASGFGHLHLHHLRHSFASIQLMSGKTLYEVKELLGHTSLTATQIYSHLSDDHMREVAEINLGPVDLGDGGSK